MRKVPRIKSVMTPFPYSIAPSASLEDAKGMMDQHDICHLPVCEGQEVVGILSERELRVGRNLGEGQDLSVKEVCTLDPLLVDLEEPLDQVTAKMAEARIGCAIVRRAGKLAGILTTTDVCRLLSKVLSDDTPGDDVA